MRRGRSCELELSCSTLSHTCTTRGQASVAARRTPRQATSSLCSLAARPGLREQVAPRCLSCAGRSPSRRAPASPSSRAGDHTCADVYGRRSRTASAVDCTSGEAARPRERSFPRRFVTSVREIGVGHAAAAWQHASVWPTVPHFAPGWRFPRALLACRAAPARYSGRTWERHSGRAMGAAFTRPTGIAFGSAHARVDGVGQFNCRSARSSGTRRGQTPSGKQY